MKNTWVKMYRSITHSAIFDDPEVLKVWIWMLCKAYYKADKILINRQEIEVLPGQFPCGRNEAARELKMTGSKFYRIVKFLEKIGCIKINSNNRFSMITLVKWGKFQGDAPIFEQQANSRRTTGEQQANTNNNIKKYKNINNINNNCVPTPKPTKFSNFTPSSGIDYKELERKALKKLLERNSDAT